MELNTKNCLGPSHESIEMTHMMQMDWFDEHVHEVTDFGGEKFTAYSAPEDEVEWVGLRMQQLEDLMDLRNPFPWHEAMLTGNCPCGVTNAQWKAREEYEAWGDDPTLYPDWRP